MTQPPPCASVLPSLSDGVRQSPMDEGDHTDQTQSSGEGFDSDIDDLERAEALSKAISKQSSHHYMLTFENGLQDDESDWEVEELTKALSLQREGRATDAASQQTENSVTDAKPNDSNNNSSVSDHQQGNRIGEEGGSTQFIPPAPSTQAHFVAVVRDSDCEESNDMKSQDMRESDGEQWGEGTHHPSHIELQIPDGDSDTDIDLDPHSDPTGGFLHVADDGNSSVRPDTPTPTTPRGFTRTRIAVDSNTDSGSEGGFIRPKPLSGSTTAVFGSMESLGQSTPTPSEVQYRSVRTLSESNKRFSASDLNLAGTPRPVEGPFGNVASRRRAFHGSMKRLSMGSVPSSQSSVAYMSDEEGGGKRAVERRAVQGKRGLSRRWSLAHADADSLNNIRLLQNQLEMVERELKEKETTYKKELAELRKVNEQQQKLIGQNLGPEAKIEATMQHEITRMTSENLDLRETIDKQSDEIRKLKKMLKIYAKKLKEGEAAEIVAELEQEEGGGGEGKGATIGATVIHRERTYMGMLEYRREDEGALIKNLILDLKPKTAAGLLPGLPAYTLFMCVRHTDYINDDEKVKSLLTATINGIKKIVKKHNDDLERVTLWLANTCRLMHTLKQYSGEKPFQTDNQPRQNEMCLRNFDLSEYRQVFSDLAIWIYQTLIKLMQELVQPNIVPAILEHEAIAGLTASKPAGLRGRSSSNARELDDDKDSMHALDALMRTLNSYMRILTQHAVDPELVKQIFRQLYYFLCAGALNNLLLRKDMCNWSKGMQIRYNLSHMEQWLRDNKLNESGAQLSLEPIIQASQLLQARKTDTDVDSICDMCSKLTTAQIVKILNLYTPVDEFEERVPISFIRKIQALLKKRPQDNAQTGASTLLMDTKLSFPVTFPFNPSSILLDTVHIPEQLHLGFLHRL